MKKIVLWTIFVYSIFLSSCALTTKQNKTQSPEETIKNTQISFINNIQNNVLVAKQAEFDGSLKINVNTPSAWWNGVLSYTGKWSKEAAQMNLNLSWLLNVQWLSWNVDLSSNFIITLDKIYIELSKLNIQLPDPQLQAYIAMSKMIMNKWFYVENSKSKISEELYVKLKNIDLKKQFEKYTLFKVNKVISDKTYDVSLNKENLSNIIYNISKEITPNFTWTKQEISDSIKEVDIIWVLGIKGDKYFTFSWNVTNGLNNTSFEFNYLKDKIYLKIQWIIIDLNKNDDKFNGTITLSYIHDIHEKLNIDWKLNENTFELNLWYNKEPINVDINLIYNAKEIDKVDIELPKDAINFQNMIQNIMWNSMWWWWSLWIDDNDK